MEGVSGGISDIVGSNNLRKTNQDMRNLTNPPCFRNDAAALPRLRLDAGEEADGEAVAFLPRLPLAVGESFCHKFCVSLSLSLSLFLS